MGRRKEGWNVTQEKKEDRKVECRRMERREIKEKRGGRKKGCRERKGGREVGRPERRGST